MNSDLRGCGTDELSPSVYSNLTNQLRRFEDDDKRNGNFGILFFNKIDT